MHLKFELIICLTDFPLTDCKASEPWLWPAGDVIRRCHLVSWCIGLIFCTIGTFLWHLCMTTALWTKELFQGVLFSTLPKFPTTIQWCLIFSAFRQGWELPLKIFHNRTLMGMITLVNRHFQFQNFIPQNTSLFLQRTMLMEILS